MTVPPNVDATGKQQRIINNHKVVKAMQREVRFGSYILGSTLGEGEFGKVKLGWRKDGKHPSQVAIKLIKRADIAKDSESEIKIHREINSLKMLNHPNIVNLVEVMKSGKYIGIVLEYASGGELFNYILQNKFLKENVAKKIFAQLVSGVDYMHSKGLIHRDLKLENLLLDKHKNVIISDFGFVNSYNKDKSDLMKTSCGSPCYAAPELVLTQQPYEGRKVDIWSLGIILFAMLSGYLPFDDDPENEDGEDIVRLYHYICKTPLTFPEYVTPLARDLLRKIVVPNPRKRVGMDSIRSHSWLTPYVNLLSVRQPEWDRLSRENSRIPTSIASQANKRFSMINEKTSSSTLMMPIGRPYSTNASTNIYTNSSAPTTSSSFAKALGFSKGNEQGDVSKRSTPSPTKQMTGGSPRLATTYESKGFAAPAPMPNSLSSASTALKAVTEQDSKRNSVVSLESLSLTQASSSARSLLPPPCSRLSSYNSPGFSTIEETASLLQDLSQADTSKDQVKATSGLPVSRETLKVLPHSHRKPRPTSYHPSSVSSSLMGVNNYSPSMFPDYIKTPTSLLATNGTKSPKNSSPVKEASVYSYFHASGSSSTLGIKSELAHPSRRNSIVTHVNVNGVLAGDTYPTENKRNSVLSYLEDKIDALDLVEHQRKPSLNIEGNESLCTTTPKIDQIPKFDTNLSPNGQPTPMNNTRVSKSNEFASNSEKNEDGEYVRDNSLLTRKIERDESSQLGGEHVNSKESSSNVDVTSEANYSNIKSQTEKENIDKEKEKAKESSKNTKKRNRFSLISLYNNYNGSSSSVVVQAASKSDTKSSKRILEPSNDANVPVRYARELKRVGSNSSKESNSNRSNLENTQSSTSVKQASAAKKVMDFFKRRSVRIG